MEDKIKKDKEKNQIGIYGNTFAFTGSLSTYTRSEAQTLVQTLNGKYKRSVTNDTDYLVLGHFRSITRLTDGKSHKLIQAESNQKKGYDIKIITEKQFIEMIWISSRSR